MRHLQPLKRTGWLLGCCFILLGARLWWINCLCGESYVALAQNQRLSALAEYEYQRGDFLDRNGDSFTNRAERVLLVFPRLLETGQNDDPAEFLNDLLAGLDIPPAPAAQSLAARLQGSAPFVLARGLSEQQVQTINKRTAKCKGLFTAVYHPRYAENSPAAHLIGYVGESTAAEAAELTQSGDPNPEYCGKSGLEQQYDGTLRGRASDRLAAAIDEQGHQAADGLRRLSAEDSGKAQNVRLTLDRGYQQICEAAMQDKNGAAVLLDAQNGDVLALVSSPGFSQSVGQPASSGDNYLNKALCYYPPASVFKLVLVLAALEEGVSIDPPTEGGLFFCNGHITLPGGNTVKCWQTSGHGAEDLTTALGNSCNPYFITLGQKLGGGLIREYAWRLGMTEQVLRGFKLNSQNMLDFNDNVPADIANVSIGEKGIRATPLMLARLLAAIANDGLLPEPRLVMDIETAGGKITKQFASAEPRRVVSEESARKLAAMLTEAVESGTGKPVKSELIGIGGKTGTTQNFGVWFACFFPADEPRWSMAVYIADGESGGRDAGAVCREVAEKLALLENIANRGKV